MDKSSRVSFSERWIVTGNVPVPGCGRHDGAGVRDGSQQSAWEEPLRVGIRNVLWQPGSLRAPGIGSVDRRDVR